MIIKRKTFVFSPLSSTIHFVNVYFRTAIVTCDEVIYHEAESAPVTASILRVVSAARGSKEAQMKMPDAADRWVYSVLGMCILCPVWINEAVLEHGGVHDRANPGISLIVLKCKVRDVLFKLFSPCWFVYIYHSSPMLTDNTRPVTSLLCYLPSIKLT